MAMQELGPAGMERRVLDTTHDPLAETRFQRLSAAQPGTRDASKAPEAESDRVEVSLAARALAAEEDSKVLARRDEHVAAMRSAIESGQLDSPERIERAVQRLLGR